MGISVLIITQNEERNLRRCIESLGPFEDIVVLDSFSSDGTVALARSLGARVYQRQFDNFAAHRNHALDAVPFQHEWVLHLDADEVLCPDLCAEVIEATRSERYDAYRIPSKMILSGTWLRRSGLYPSYQVRLGRLRALRFKLVGHGQREDIDPSRVGTLKNPYLHYSFSHGWASWFQKHVRYSSHEAREGVKLIQSRECDWKGLLTTDPVRRRRALKQLAARLPARSLTRFLYMYVLRRGFLDGRPGFTYCALLSIYEYMISLQLRDMRRKPLESEFVPSSIRYFQKPIPSPHLRFDRLQPQSQNYRTLEKSDRRAS